MSMAREEAIKLLENKIYKWSMDWDEREDGLDYAEAIEIAIAALRHRVWEEQLWHDAETDPPKTPGLYYGKKDNTNAIYACRYLDGVWVLDMYPQQQMDIIQWADYAAFVLQDEDTPLRSASREQVEKVWRGEWNYSHKTKIDGFDVVQCSKCGQEALTLALYVKNGNFCPYCGAPMTDEAVDILLKRLEVLHNGWLGCRS